MDRKNTKAGFIGQGWIGKNYANDFERRGFRVVRYSKETPYLANGGEIKDCDIVFIAVPVPTTPNGFDDSILRQAIKLVGRGKIAVIKSTILPGTTESIQQENPDIFVFNSPEFLTEVNAAYDAANPNRNIVGIPIDNYEYRQKAQEVLDVLPDAPYQLICPSREAELIKYGGNCWFYFKVVYMNMLHDLAKKLDCKWETVRNAMAADPRIGRTHLDVVHKNGRGAGGDCFIKDFASFAEMYRKHTVDDLGVKVLENLVNKNIDLLVSTAKDLGLLTGVYGQDFVDSVRKSLPAEKNKYLVTGGAGFIGSNLVDELINRGHEVVIIDNLSTGKRENINPAAEFHELDIRDLEKIKPLFQGVDYVFHLAALPRVQISIENPSMTNDVNLNGVLNVLIAARDTNVKKVIYSSSAAVYGNQEQMPLKESMSVTPISPYGLHKYLGEFYCQLFSRIYGLSTVCLRYFNAYGKRQTFEGAYTLVMAIFSKQKLNNEPLTIVGDGEQRRDFVNVSDIVEANILAAHNKKIGKGEVVNIGSGKDYSINEIASFFGGPTVNIPPRIEPRQSLADNTLARELLGWEPKVDLHDWIKEHRKEIGIFDSEMETESNERLEAESFLNEEDNFSGLFEADNNFDYDR